MANNLIIRITKSKKWVFVKILILALFLGSIGLSTSLLTARTPSWSFVAYFDHFNCVSCGLCAEYANEYIVMNGDYPYFEVGGQLYTEIDTDDGAAMVDIAYASEICPVAALHIGYH